MVPLGDLYISDRLNSLTRCSSGVMVAHLIPTLYFKMACAASIVTWSLVYERSFYKVEEIVRSSIAIGIKIWKGRTSLLFNKHPCGLF